MALSLHFRYDSYKTKHLEDANDVSLFTGPSKDLIDDQVVNINRYYGTISTVHAYSNPFRGLKYLL